MLEYSSFVFFLSVFQVVIGSSVDKFDLVNPFIGSGGSLWNYGSVPPVAQMPFSPMRLGPDTITTVLDDAMSHTSGYNYNDTIVRSFSHQHMIGAGVNDLGVLGIMPYATRDSSADDLCSEAPFWWSVIDKTSEKAQPGKYALTLVDRHVEVELLAIGRHAGVHKYTWRKSDIESKERGVVIDLCHSAQLSSGLLYTSHCINSSLTIDPNNLNKFMGTVYFNGTLSGTTMFYVSGQIQATSPVVSKTVQSWKVCSGYRMKEQCTSKFTGKYESSTGLLFSMAQFPSAGSGDLTVEVSVGMSRLSVDQASENLNAARAGLNYEQLAARTKQIWTDALDTVSFEAMEGDDNLLEMLYTATYRSLMTPTLYTEGEGLYLGLDGAVHNVTAERLAVYGDSTSTSPLSYEWFSDLSLWDTFRTSQPWLLLVNEDLAVGIARSMVEMTQQQDSFPRWVLGDFESSCMLANHGSAVILETVLAGLGKEIDVATAQKALLKQSTEEVTFNYRYDVNHYIEQGYVRQDVYSKSAGETLSYAFDDHILSQLSAYVGDHTAAEAALKRSKNYANIWNADRLLFCPKFDNGTLVCPEDPTSVAAWYDWREGNALHWSWFVPHDVKGLIALYPSPETFDAVLNDFFVQHLKYVVNASDPNPYYWAGNEHDMLTPFMFNFGPNCTRTQYWSRQVTELHFSTLANGLPGNDDYGTMSTFLLFTSLGFYPQAGSTTYLLTAPRVKSATVQLKHFDGSVTSLSVLTHNNSKDNVFVERLLVNGVEYTSPLIDRSVLTKGDVKLEFFMHGKPVSGLCGSV